MQIIRLRYRGLLLALFLILLLLVASFMPAAPESAVAANGVLDLREYSFEETETLNLNGTWEFYWDQFVLFDELGAVSPDLYANVPDYWDAYYLDGKPTPGFGHATYRLHVITDLPVGSEMAFRANCFSSAYELFVNEQSVMSNGKPSETAEDEIAQYEPKAGYFKIPAKEFDVLIHVSNHLFYTGGFWWSLAFGAAEDIADYDDFMKGRESFLLGVLMIVALFELTVFVIRPELRAYLYGALLCIAAAVMVDTIGEYAVSSLVPWMSVKQIVFLFYSSTNWMAFLFLIHVKEIFHFDGAKWLIRGFLGYSIAFQLLVFFLPVQVYTSFGLIALFVCLVEFLAAFGIGVIAIRRGRKDGWINVISMVVILFCFAHDSLFQNYYFNSPLGETLYFGLFLFIFLQLLIQGNRIRRNFDEKAATELAFLQAQIKPHFLYNAINTFVSLSYYDIEKGRELMVNFAGYLRGSFDFKNLSQMTSLENEVRLSEFYVEIEKARFEERLSVEYTVEADLAEMVPILMLEPVIENAINHGVLKKHEGGRVEILIRRESKSILFEVRDNGIGMEPEALKQMKANPSETGVGLFNIDRRLKALYGKGLRIESEPSVGTVVSWEIPLRKRRKQ